MAASNATAAQQSYALQRFGLVGRKVSHWAWQLMSKRAFELLIVIA